MLHCWVIVIVNSYLTVTNAQEREGWDHPWKALETPMFSKGINCYFGTLFGLPTTCGVQCSSPARSTLPGRTTGAVLGGFGLAFLSVEPRNVLRSSAVLGPPSKRSILESLWWDRPAVLKSLKLLYCQGGSADATHIPRN